MRQACGKGRAIIEDILRLTLCAPQLLFESIYIIPELENFFLLFGEAAQKEKAGPIMITQIFGGGL